MRWYVFIVIVLLISACGSDDLAKNNVDNTNNVNNTNNANNTNNVNNTNNTNNANNTNNVNNTNNTTNNTTNNGTGRPGPCPMDPPADKDPCDQLGVVCAFGDDPRETCQLRATCEATGWTLNDPKCDPIPPIAACPATREEAANKLCDPKDAICTYEGGLDCLCTNCLDGPVGGCNGEPKWRCEAPNPDSECPVSWPRVGDACDMDGKECEYHCGLAGARTCKGGVWTETEGGPCPISTRRAKKDIHYLDTAQLEAVSRQVQSLRLATYEYIDPALQGRQNLGFIIEDAPAGSPAVFTQKNMVDLYGYTSMLVADAQAKDAAIKSLRKEVEALRKEVRQGKASQ